MASGKHTGFAISARATNDKSWAFSPTVLTGAAAVAAPCSQRRARGVTSPSGSFATPVRFLERSRPPRGAASLPFCAAGGCRSVARNRARRRESPVTKGFLAGGRGTPVAGPVFSSSRPFARDVPKGSRSGKPRPGCSPLAAATSAKPAARCAKPPWGASLRPIVFLGRGVRLGRDVAGTSRSADVQVERTVALTRQKRHPQQAFTAHRKSLLNGANRVTISAPRIRIRAAQ
jgi:hypothetical protein